jgi:hypothetical protein
MMQGELLLWLAQIVRLLGMSLVCSWMNLWQPPYLF